MNVRVRTKIWLDAGGRFVIGEGGAHLLAAIDRLGSLSAAAHDIGWSYRHAWGYLRRAERVLGARLTVSRPGKGAARGTRLTDAGRRLLSVLEAVRGRLDGAIGATGLTADEVAARGRTRGEPARNT